MSGIVIAPFSNSAIRDWPAAHFEALVGLLLDRLPRGKTIQIVGTKGQKLRANDIVRNYPLDRVVNACGRLSWAEVVQAVRTADCVIGNNSGLSHLSGYLGTPTVCVFGGSHQRHEWRPLGFNVVLVSRAIGCSPCQLDHGKVSPYGKACLREIAPRTVADAVFALMDKVASRGSAGAETQGSWSRFGGSLT